MLLNSLHSLAPPTTWLCTVSLADDLARVTRTCRYSSSLLADACRCPEDLADDLGKQFSTRNIDRDCIIFNKFLRRSGMVCDENLMIIILLSFTASEPACHLDCEVSIFWSQPAAVMRDVLALQILTITSLFLDNTNPRTKVKMSSDKTVQ